MEITHPSERSVKLFTYGGCIVAGLATTACIATAPYTLGRASAFKEAHESGRSSVETSELRHEKEVAVDIEFGLGL